MPYLSKMTREEYMQMYDIVGACMEVFNTVGHGMAEPVYQEMLAFELTDRKIPFEREKPLQITYKGHLLSKCYNADFYSNGVVVELKAVDNIGPEHRAQLFNYLRITGQKRGILVNFGESNLHTERYLYQEYFDDYALITEKNLKDYII